MSRRWLLKLLDHGPFPAIVLALSLSHINVEQKRGLSSVERQIVRLPVSRSSEASPAIGEGISASVRVLGDKRPYQLRLASDPKIADMAVAGESLEGLNKGLAFER